MIGPTEAQRRKNEVANRGRKRTKSHTVKHKRPQKETPTQKEAQKETKERHYIDTTFTKQRINHTETMNNIPQTINMSHHGRRIDAHNTFLHQLITSVGSSFTNQENLCNLPTTNRKHQQLLGCVDNRAPCMFCILSRRPQYIKPCRHGKLQIQFIHSDLIEGNTHNWKCVNVKVSMPAMLQMPPE